MPRIGVGNLFKHRNYTECYASPAGHSFDHRHTKSFIDGRQDKQDSVAIKRSQLR
jgi:hypothetical protein